MFKKRALLDLKSQRLRIVGLLCVDNLAAAVKEYLDDRLEALNYLIAAIENQLEATS